MARNFRNNKGQFLIASALLIAILFISVASLLSSTTITDVKLLKDDFRKDVTQIVSNFRGALALANSEVSKELELRSSMYSYENYTTLEEYPDAEIYGAKMMTDWQNTILQQYAGRSINLTITNLEFECEWNSSEYYFEYYSKASATLNLDMLSYGFYGLKQNVTSELRLQILDRTEQGKKAAFTIQLQEENDLPVTDLEASLVKIFYMNGKATFTEVDPSNIGVTYLGSGFYNITFSAGDDYQSPAKIKMILRDGRGIVVAAINKGGVLVSQKNDTDGPITTKVLATPNPCTKPSTTKLTATVNDTSTDANIIISAEYFVDATGGNGSGTPMSVSDGYFDSLVENVQAQLSTADLSYGNHVIYVHGRDAVGNWGNFSSVVLNVTGTQQTQKMHILNVDVQTSSYKWFFYTYVRGVATVTVVDASGNPVPEVKVSGHWSFSISGTPNEWTDSNGEATFHSTPTLYQGWGGWGGWFGGKLTFTFTVDNLVKDGWTYDKAADVKTSDTDYYP